jgi:hypothetical protein
LKIAISRKFKIVVLLGSVCLVLSAIVFHLTRSHWWMRDYSAVVFVGESHVNSGVIYRSRTGVDMIYAVTADPHRGEPTLCYLVNTSDGDVECVTAEHLSRFRLDEAGAGFMLFPWAAVSKDVKPISWSVWKWELDPHLVRDKHGYEFTGATGASVRVTQ